MADSTSAYTVKTIQRLLEEFWYPTDRLPYLPDFKSLDFSICSVLQAKVKATPHSNLASLHQSIAVEWDWLAAAYIRKTCHSFRCAIQPSLRKMKFKLNRWLANSPAQTYHGFYVLAVMFWLSYSLCCPGCPVLTALFQLSCTGYPFSSSHLLAIMFCLMYSCCTVGAVMF